MIKVKQAVKTYPAEGHGQEVPEGHPDRACNLVEGIVPPAGSLQEPQEACNGGIPVAGGEPSTTLGELHNPAEP